MCYNANMPILVATCQCNSLASLSQVVNPIGNFQYLLILVTTSTSGGARKIKGFGYRWNMAVGELLGRIDSPRRRNYPRFTKMWVSKLESILKMVPKHVQVEDDPCLGVGTWFLRGWDVEPNIPLMNYLNFI